MDEFDFIALRSIDKREAAPILAQDGPVGVIESQRMQVFSELFEAVDFKGQVSEIGLHLDGSAAWETADFDLFVAFRRLQKDELGPARGLVPSNFLESEHLFVELNGFFEIVDPVSCVQQFPGFHWRRTIPAERGGANKYRGHGRSSRDYE